MLGVVFFYLLKFQMSCRPFNASLLRQVERTTLRDILDERRSFDEFSMPKFVDELSDDDDDDDDEKYQLTQWFPSDFNSAQQEDQQQEWMLNNPVIVTDVTVDDMTVTMIESQKPEGFFKKPVELN